MLIVLKISVPRRLLREGGVESIDFLRFFLAITFRRSVDSVHSKTILTVWTSTHLSWQKKKHVDAGSDKQI